MTMARNQYQDSTKKNATVVIVDQFLKMIRLKVTTIAASLEKITKLYQDKIWKLHKIPRKILNNRGPQFASKFMKDLTKILETKRTLSIAYHPQIDGQME